MTTMMMQRALGMTRSFAAVRTGTSFTMRTSSGGCMRLNASHLWHQRQACRPLLSVQRGMAGHSKWANIKHRKGIADRKRAALFQKLSRAIITAVKTGKSTDPEANTHLKTAISSAKSNDMPNPKIEASIRIGAGLDADYQKFCFELAGPGGTQLLVFAEAEKRDRVVPELRRVTNKFGGSIGKDGSSMWAFKHQGVLDLPAAVADAVDVEELALELDAEDVEMPPKGAGEDLPIRLTCAPMELTRIQQALAERSVDVETADDEYTPTTMAHPSDTELQQVRTLIGKLEEVEQVTMVVTNIDTSQDSQAGGE